MLILIEADIGSECVLGLLPPLPSSLVSPLRARPQPPVIVDGEVTYGKFASRGRREIEFPFHLTVYRTCGDDEQRVLIVNVVRFGWCR